MSLINTFGGLLDRGAEFVIAREERKERERLPAGFETANEKVVNSTPPAVTVENDRMAEGSAGKFGEMLRHPVVVGIAVATVSGLIVAAIRSNLGGRKR